MMHAERKKRRERKHGRLAWVLAALVLLAGSVTAAILLSRKPTADIPARTDPGGTLVQRQPEELVSLTVTRRGEKPWTLIRDADGRLRLEGESRWAAQEWMTAMIEDAVVNLVYADVLTENPADYRENLADFGLAEPMIIAEAVFSDGETIAFRIGDKMGLEEGWRYMTVDGDDRLFAVSPALAEDLDLEQEMLHPVTQPEIYPVLLDRITVTGQDGNIIAEWRLRGIVQNRDAGTSWEVTEPFRYPADEETIGNLKTSAGNLRMGIFLEEATPENLEKRGLANPAYTLELHMAAGSTGTVSSFGVYDVVDREESTVILYVARSENEMVDYVRYGDEIFSVSHFTLAAFLETEPLMTAARYIAPTPLNSLESLTVEQDGTARTYTLERTGDTDPETGEEIIRCRLDGEEFPYAMFAAAYNRLMTVTVSGKLPAGAEWKEPHTQYTFRSVSGGTHTVALSDWDGVHDAVTFDGGTIFYLIKKGADFQIGTGPGAAPGE